MEYPFDVQVLWVLKPGHIPANRARYQIFSGRLELLASAVGIERRGSQASSESSAPYSSVLEIVGVDGGPLLRMTRNQKEWTTEFRDAEGALVGTIQTGKTWRRYTFLNGAGKAIAKVTGDPGLREFSVSAASGAGNAVNGRKLASVRKTRAGLFKEMSAPNEHYEVGFTGPVPDPLRVLTVMMPLVLDHIPPGADPNGDNSNKRARGPGWRLAASLADRLATG